MPDSSPVPLADFATTDTDTVTTTATTAATTLADTSSHIIVTPDGSRTAHNARYDEAYGSRHGASTQAHHVFIEGTDTHLHPTPHVLEIGFGVGVNFRATLAEMSRRGGTLEYLAYEFDPAPAEVLREVAQGGEGAGHPLWASVVRQWPTTPLSPGHPPLRAQHGNLHVTIHFANALHANLPQDWATALYLDGFSPSRNPEVWTPEFVARLAQTLVPGGMLATYSAAGHVRRAMQAAGLQVERRPGAPGKRECLRAVRQQPEQAAAAAERHGK